MPATEIINRNELRIIGMSRSGNHAIIHWLLEALKAAGSRRICWLNCPEPAHNPFATARPFDDGSRHLATYPVDIAREAADPRHLTPKDHLLYNYEDTFLRYATSEHFEQHHDEWVGPSACRRDILILRDPFNLFASRRKTLAFHAVPDRTAIRIWKQHARQFALGPKALRYDPVLILYNRWKTDRDYRAAICNQLDLPFTDAGLDRVAPVVGGSSFDGLRYDGKASRMPTHQRWRQCIADPDYRAIFDEKTLQFAEQLFGPLPAIEALRNPKRKSG